MKAHRFIHTGVRPFACTVCNQSFTRYQHLVDHSVRHTGSKPHVCEHCGAQFSRPSSLKVHYRLHSGELPYSCEVCGAAFAQSSNLIQHTRSHHTHDKPYVCSFCDERFAWTKDRALHEMRRHTHDKPFSCDVCGWQCLTKYDLRNHEKSRHGGERPAKLHHCSHCTATFSKKSALVRHVRKHFSSHKSDEESSSMAEQQPSVPGDHHHDMVGYQTTQKHSRRESMMDRPRKPSTLASRQHYCPHCQLSFSSLASLSRHVRTHFAVSDSEGEEQLATDEHEQSSTGDEQVS